MKLRQKKTRCGFTLVELLTTLTVIGVLLALLIPALSQVQKTALNIKQKAQFHAIGLALEAFRNDYHDYPPSAWDNSTTDGNSTYYGPYTASQRLAEALVGQDGFGFHQSSLFRGDGTIDGTPATALYAPAVDLSADPDNLKMRKGPYLELENANAVKLSQIYSSYGTLVDSFILADMYKITKNAATGKMTGSPILYYKANKMAIGHSALLFPSQCTYNVLDSLGDMVNGIASLRPLTGSKLKHDMFTSGGVLFYDKTLNPNFPGDPATGIGARPYRADSFLLQSAGPDGEYGTIDDVFNFDQDK